MTDYFRPLVQSGATRPEDAVRLAGGWCWFDRVEVLRRDAPAEIIPASDLPQDVRTRLTKPRAPIASLRFDRPQIMGILNVTPDSFSDGGRHNDLDQAVATGLQMQADGADVIDIGGESTRPGAAFVEIEEETRRTAPVIAALKSAGLAAPISIDTRKAQVARAAMDAGAGIVNDVAGFTFDPNLAPLCAEHKMPVCVMHAQGDPATMQADPQYGDVLLDVYDFLAERIAILQSIGIPHDKIIADPGIGFGKTLEHNLQLLQKIDLFHALGVPILLGASRKRFIGTISGVTEASDRIAGSLAVALAAIEQGVQIVRVHDVAETAQARALWSALREGYFEHG